MKKENLLQRLFDYPESIIPSIIQKFKPGYEKWNRERPVGHNLKKHEKKEVLIQETIFFDIPAAILGNIYLAKNKVRNYWVESNKQLTLQKIFSSFPKF